MQRLGAAAAELAWWESHGTGDARTRIAKLRRGGLSYVLYQLSKKKAIPVSARTFWGGRFACYLPDYFFLLLYGVLGDSAEISLTRFIVKNLRKGDVFLDVGANCGFYSALAARLVGPTGHVHAFEPTPAILALLRRNTADFTTVAVSPVALSDENGMAPFYVSDTVRVANSLLVAHAPQAGNAITVATRRLDDYCAEHAVTPTVIKIDVEGAEAMVLRGGKSTILSALPVITLEIRKGVDERPYREAMRLLLEAGYRMHRLTWQGDLQAVEPRRLLENDSQRGFENLVFTAH